MNKRNEMRKAMVIVAASSSELGPLPVAHVLRVHLATINGWRDQGASWDQIAMILRDAGWRTKSGGVVSAQVVRATVSRIKQSQRPRTRAAVPLAAAVPTVVDISRHSQCDYRQPDHPVVSDVAERIRRAAEIRSGKDKD